MQPAASAARTSATPATAIYRRSTTQRDLAAGSESVDREVFDQHAIQSIECFIVTDGRPGFDRIALEPNDPEVVQRTECVLELRPRDALAQGDLPGEVASLSSRERLLQP